MKSRLKLTLFSALAAAALLSACGIKPGSLEPPQGKDKNTYPRVYPAKETLEP